ncbi:calcium-translocating P-type ATPase [Sistotremastrum niveocremeum HHB9708]|uniref:Calcium-transporting ATPase n=1 Tax=Sistotremastrum niveocremeum HHB9708 TaxID=1314777 RepID=A0A164VHC9_9AGAM|nr:calcium-translocating P-type ATPase [Sistotremastrum niveocremeum HHB9708]
MESLNLLGSGLPGAGGGQHHRKNSTATSAGSIISESAEGTDPDPHQSLTPLGLTHTRGDRSDITSYTAASPTVTHVEPDSPTRNSTKDKGKSKGSDPSDTSIHHVDASSDDTNPAPFKHPPLVLASLVDPKSLESLNKLGGVDSLISSLGTHRTKGLSYASAGSHPMETGTTEERDSKFPLADDPPTIPRVKSDDGDDDFDSGPAFSASVDDRKRVYGSNVIPTRQSKSLLLLMWLALKDKVLVLLSIAAVVSLALGLFQDFGTKRETVACGPTGEQQCELPPVDWVEGVAIMVAIIIVVVVGSVNDWQKEKQFKSLNEKKEDRGVKVIRGGREHDVLVGDIALLEPGEIIPCDGIVLSQRSLRCDESGATGESDAIRKLSYEDCVIESEKLGEDNKKDCFLISGSKVLEGVGSYLVIAVGQKSFNGRIMMALRGDTEDTPLQLKLNALAELIAKLGSLAGLFLFSALMIKFFVQLKTDPDRSSTTKALSFVQILIISVTLVVVAVPEGLPLAVTLALAFATKRMTKENLLVRVLGSCETMANASVVCTDKTGTLTQNSMKVVAGSIGIHAKFVLKLEDNQARTNAGEEPGVSDEAQAKAKSNGSKKHADDFSIDQSEVNQVMSGPLKELFNESIAVNSTAFEDADAETGKVEFVGSKTETALLQFAKDLGWENYKTARDRVEVVQMIPFSSERKAMGVVIKTPQGKWRLYLKGASEILSKRCTSHVEVRPPHAEGGELASDSHDIIPIDELSRDNISRTIIFYANQTLRTIALCYRDFDSWPPFGGDEEEVPYEELARELTLIAIVGIEDPLRDGVREAVANCRKAGVQVKMCTGDNVLTARSIASQCGIFTPGGIVMEGPVFRTLDDHEMLEVLPRLQVLARSSPEDKKILVDRLKSMGEIVGVTGDGTNDGPALKTAHVGFSMGIAGTEVAKEASDIILMDDNFTSIVSAIIWGRCVNDAVRKFLQFQISVNIAAVLITFISAVASSSEESVLSAVQLLWINIIMDTFAALALATDPASMSLLDRMPDKKTAPLFTLDMAKQIVGHSLYQTAVVLVFHFAGAAIFGFHHEAVAIDELHNQNVLKTMVFNAFVFCQIFNSINCRRLDRKFNIFEGLSKNYYFIAITGIEVVVQIIIVFVGGAAFQVTRIGGREWAASVLLGLASIPLGALIRLIPNEPIERFLQKWHIMKKPEELPSSTPNPGDWHSAIDLVRDNLNTFSNLRGARMRSSSFVIKSRQARAPHDNLVALPSIMTMVPTIVATSVAGRWTGQGSLSDPAHADPSRSSAALWEGKVQLHPDTAKDDPAYVKWGNHSTASTPGV